jgi:RNA polymerase sigma-70 factor (ECF subfamily)
MQGREAWGSDLNEVLGGLRERVYAQTMRVLPDADSAEDICQEVLLAVFRNWPSFEGKAKITSWAYRITVNTIASHYRRVGRERWAREARYREINGWGVASRPLCAIDERKLSGLVRRFAGELPAAQRAAVALTLQGLRPTEIAGTLNVRPGTARSNLHRGRRKIVERIRSMYPKLLAELSDADGKARAFPPVGGRRLQNQAHEESEEAR